MSQPARASRLAEIAVLASLLALALALGACTHAGVVVGDHHPPVVTGDHGHGPPPHAPAHGYRRTHQDAHHGGDIELVFDSGLGVYVVVGFPSHYWLEGTYYRESGGSFEIAASIDGPWSASASRSLPPGLAKAKGKPGHAKGNGKNEKHCQQRQSIRRQREADDRGRCGLPGCCHPVARDRQHAGENPQPGCAEGEHRVAKQGHEEPTVVRGIHPRPLVPQCVADAREDRSG